MDRRRLVVLLLLPCVSIFLTISGCRSKAVSATLADLKGAVNSRPDSLSAFSEAKNDDILPAGGAVKTGDDGRVKLRFPDGTELEMMPDSLFEVGSEKILGNQADGAVWYKIPGQKDRLEIRSRDGITAVLGTKFFIKIATDTSSIGLEEGSISFTSSKTGETKTLKPLQKITVQASGKIDEPADFNPVDEEFRFLQINGKWIRQK